MPIFGSQLCNRSYITGVGASTATPALAIVDIGPMYLVGLLRATYSCKIYVSSYVLVLVTGEMYMYQISINSARCGLHLRIISLVLDICKSSCNIDK